MTTAVRRKTPTSKRRRRYLPSAERKPKILDAAFVEFSNRGYTSTTVEAIAARAGLSKAGIYAHYKSKEDIFEDLLMTVLVPSERGEISLDRDNALESIVESYLDGVYLAPEQPKTLATFRLLVLESRRIPAALLRRWHGRIMACQLLNDRALLDECIRRGIIRRGVMTDSRLLVGTPAVSWICHHLLFGEDTFIPLAEMRQDHKRMLMELLSPR